MHPQLDELIDVCLKHGVGHVVLAGGLPPGWRDRRGQGRWRQADRLRPGAGAGQEADPLGRRCAGDRRDGGRRPYRPGVADRCWRRKSCRTCHEVPVFVAGGIGRGEAIAAYLEMGASASSSAPASSPRPSASPIPTSRRPSSAPRRATRCPRSRSIRASRSSRSAGWSTRASSASCQPGEVARSARGRRADQGSRAACRSSITGPARCAAR